MFSEYPSNRRICIVTTITHYLEITKDLRTTDQLIITYKKSHNAVTTSTISRWCKVIFGKAGIDIEKYLLHSTRSASTSKAKVKGVSLTEINKAAGWKETSRRFYDKPILKTFEDLVIQWHVMVKIFNIYYVYTWKILSVFSNHINIYLICCFKNPVYFEMDWVSYCEEFPNHTSTVRDGWLQFYWAIYLTQAMGSNLALPKYYVIPPTSHSFLPLKKGDMYTLDWIDTHVTSHGLGQIDCSRKL